MASPGQETGATADGAPDPVSDADVERFIALRGALQGVIRKHGSLYFEDKPPHGFAGLLNQGATCYLNSLLQGLLHSPQLVERLSAWDGEEAAPAARIVRQLQLLFARMTEGSQRACSTSDLTASFGWTSGEAFRQQDVMELFHVLLDALDVVRQRSKPQAGSEPAAGEGSLVSDADQQEQTKKEQQQQQRQQQAQQVQQAAAGNVGDLFRGRCTDTIRCLSCGFERSKPVPFSDLEMTIVGHKNLHSSFAAYTSPETLDGDNQWYCPECSQKRDATKQLRLLPGHMPPLLAVHLKRFVFDLNLMRRVKVHTSYQFPSEMELSGTPYALHAILMHTGTAVSGHYFAYIRPDGPGGKWYEFNDLSVTELLPGKGLGVVTRALSDVEDGPAEDEEEGPAVKGGQDGKEEEAEGKPGAADGEEAAAAAPPPPPEQQPQQQPAAAGSAAEAQAKTGKAAGAAGNAYLLLYARRELFDARAAAAQHRFPPSVSERVAAEMKAFETLRWAYQVRCRVCEVELYGLVPSDQQGGDGAPTADAAAPRSISLSGAPRPRHHRRRSSEASGAEAGQSAALAFDGAVPASMAVGALEWQMLRRLAEQPSPAAEAAVAEGDGGDGKGSGPSTSLPPHIQAAVEALVAAGVTPQQYATAEATAPAVAELQALARLRKFDPASGIPTNSYETARDKSLKQASLAPGASVVIETRTAEQAATPWTTWDPEAMVVTVVRYDPALDRSLQAAAGSPEEDEEEAGEEAAEGALSSLPLEAALSRMPACAVTVPGGAEATVGDLAVSIACSGLGIPVSNQRVWAVDGDSLVELSKADDAATLRGDLGIWPGSVLVTEVTMGSLGGFVADSYTPRQGAPPSPARPSAASAEDSPFSQRFVAERSVISVSFNQPSASPAGAATGVDDVPEYDRAVRVRKTETLADLKQAIATALGLEPAEFHLRRNVRAPQFKDNAMFVGKGKMVTSVDPDSGERRRRRVDGMELVEGSIVHVTLGAQLAPDEHVLKVYRYTPGNKKGAYALACSIPGAERSTIHGLKRRVAEAVGCEAPVSCIRLRDKRGREAGKIFRDDQTLRSAIPRLADGCEVAMQILPEPESIGPGDMVVQARRIMWQSPDDRLSLSPTLELILPRRCRLQQLQATLASVFRIGVERREAGAAGAAGGGGRDAGDSPAAGNDTAGAEPSSNDSAGGSGPSGSAQQQGEEEQGEEEAAAAAAAASRGAVDASDARFRVGVAKWSAHGGKLTRVKLAGLKWNEQRDPGALISAMPLGVRDGAIIICRDEMDKDKPVLKPGEGGKDAKGGGDAGRRKPWQRRGGARPRPARRDAGGVVIRPGAAAAGKPAGPLEEWACSACTFANSSPQGQVRICEMCGTPNS